MDWGMTPGVVLGAAGVGVFAGPGHTINLHGIETGRR
jgi:hypothetical protein